MGRQVVVEIPDEAYAAVEKAAQADGVTPAEWIAAKTLERLPDNGRMEAENERPTATTDVHAFFAEQAAARGISLEAYLAELGKHTREKPRPPLSPEEAEAARRRFERHCGAVDLGAPTGADNDSIDADLARAYELGSAAFQREG